MTYVSVFRSSMFDSMQSSHKTCVRSEGWEWEVGSAEVDCKINLSKNVKSVNSEPFLPLPISVFAWWNLKMLLHVFLGRKLLSSLVYIVNKGNIFQTAFAKALCTGIKRWSSNISWTAWLKVVKGWFWIVKMKCTDYNAFISRLSNVCFLLHVNAMPCDVSPPILNW